MVRSFTYGTCWINCTINKCKENIAPPCRENFNDSTLPAGESAHMSPKLLFNIFHHSNKICFPVGFAPP